MAGAQFIAAHVWHRGDLHRPWSLGSRYERRRIARTGLPRNRTSQAAKSQEGWAGHLHLQHGFHLAGFFLCGDDYPGRCPPGFSGKSHRRPGDESRGAAPYTFDFPRVRSGGRRGDSRWRC